MRVRVVAQSGEGGFCFGIAHSKPRAGGPWYGRRSSAKTKQHTSSPFFGTFFSLPHQGVAAPSTGCGRTCRGKNSNGSAHRQRPRHVGRVCAAAVDAGNAGEKRPRRGGG